MQESLSEGDGIERGACERRVANHFVGAVVDSAINSDRSRMRSFSSSERDLTASSIIVMQNGLPTANVSGFAMAI